MRAISANLARQERICVQDVMAQWGQAPKWENSVKHAGLEGEGKIVASSSTMSDLIFFFKKLI